MKISSKIWYCICQIYKLKKEGPQQKGYFDMFLFSSTAERTIALVVHKNISIEIFFTSKRICDKTSLFMIPREKKSYFSTQQCLQWLYYKRGCEYVINEEFACHLQAQIVITLEFCIWCVSRTTTSYPWIKLECSKIVNVKKVRP